MLEMHYSLDIFKKAHEFELNNQWVSDAESGPIVPYALHTPPRQVRESLKAPCDCRKIPDNVHIFPRHSFSFNPEDFFLY